MIWRVKLVVRGQVFVEAVRASNQQEAVEVALNLHPNARLIGVTA